MQTRTAVTRASRAQPLIASSPQLRILAVTAVFAALIVAVRNPYYGDMLIMTMFYAAMGLAWNIVGGFCGQLSLGHTVFFGIGGYAAALLFLRLGISPWVGMVVGGVLSSAVGFLLGAATLRLRGPYFTLATLALSEIFLLLANYFERLTGGATGLILPGRLSFSSLSFGTKQAYGFCILGFLACLLLISERIKSSRWGYFFYSIKDQEEAAQALGVPAAKYKVLAFVVSAFLTSIGGSFYTCYLHYADPDVLFSVHHSIQFAMVAVIGGAGTVAGPVLGSVLLTPIDSLLKGWLGGQMEGLAILVYGCVLVGIVLFMPSGIVVWLKSRSQAREGEAGTDSIATRATGEGIGDLARGDTPRRKSDGEVVLDVGAISKSFGGLMALDGIRFKVHRGEILGIIGPNGAGKTTLFNIIAGAIRPDKGTILYRSRDIAEGHRPDQICALGLTRTFQIVKPFSSLSVLDNVAVGAFSHARTVSEAREYARRVVIEVGLGHRIGSETKSLTIADLKRLELAKALATRPEVLLLDEVMTGLTPTETQGLIRLVQEISESGTTILVIEHVLRAVMALSHRLIVLNYGEIIAEGAPDEIRANPRVVEAYFGRSRRLGDAGSR